MSTHSPARPEPGRERVRRPSHRTAVSILALALGLSACAGTGTGTNPPVAQSHEQKNAMLLKIADETNAGGDPATAASLYRQLHDMAPTDPVPLARLAASFMAMQDYRSASQAYRASLALDPSNADLRRGLALALLMIDDPQGAMTEARTALAKDARDPRLYSVLGVAQDMLGQHDLAQQTYRHGLEIAPGNKGLQNNYAMSLALSGEYADAVAKLSQIANSPGEPRYRLNLALAYGLAGDDANAAAAARDLLDESSVQNNLAYYALLRGMDVQHRTAAIIGAELHGSAVSVADAPVKSSPAVAQSASAPVTMAAVSPPREVQSDPLPLLPTEPAKAERPAPSRHVAALADHAPAKGKPTSLLPEANALNVAPVEGTPPTPPTAAPGKSAADATVKPEAAATPKPTSAPHVSGTDAAATTNPPQASESKPPTADPLPEAPLPDRKSANPLDGSALEASPGFLIPPPPLPPAGAFNEFWQPASAPSHMAALAIPMLSSPAPSATQPPHVMRSGVERYTVQLGSFMYEASAHRIADEFAAKGMIVTISLWNDRDGREWFVARSGAFDTAEDASGMLEMIQSMGAVAPMVVHYHIPAPKGTQAT